MIIAAVLLLFFLIYKEIKRVNKAHLVFRVLAVFTATAAMVFLIVPLKYKLSKVADPTRLHLLTNGANFNDLKEHTYFTTDSLVLLNSGIKNITYLPDLAYYLQAHGDINSIGVYGYGLTHQELTRIKNYGYDFTASPSPSGIISCSWPHKLKKTALLNVQGVFNNTGDEPVKLLLEGLGSKLDSVFIKAHAQGHFSLKSEGRQIGRALYTVTALQRKDTLEKERIPFQVTEPPKIKLLVLSSFPDFEYKFLKNWLFENKYQVVFRTRVSKDKFSIDQLNMDGINPQQLNASLLAKFDGVIADDEELSKFSPADLSSLSSAVNEGLGLLIRANEVKPLSEFTKMFQIYAKADSVVKTFSPVFFGEPAVLKELPVSQYLYIQPRLAEQPLVRDKSGKVLISTSLYGNGKVSASMITSTFNWVLTGNKRDYAQFWSRIISSTIRKEEDPVSWRTIPAMLVKGHQTSLIYQSRVANSMPEIYIGQVKLNPVQHQVLPNSWQSTFWPKQTGWNEVKTGNNTEYLFVYGEMDWKSLKGQQTLMENLANLKNPSVKIKNSQVLSGDMEKEVSKWWFFALFLISTGYIWFETKML